MVQQFYKMKFFLKMYLFFQNKMLYYCSTAAKRTFRLHELPPALRKEHLALKKLKHRILSFYHLQQPWLRTRCNCKNSSPKPEDLHVQSRPARQSPPGWFPESPPRTRGSEQYTSPPAKRTLIFIGLKAIRLRQQRRKIQTWNDVSVTGHGFWLKKPGFGVPYKPIPVPGTVPYLPVYWNTDFKMPAYENEPTDPYYLRYQDGISSEAQLNKVP